MFVIVVRELKRFITVADHAVEAEHAAKLLQLLGTQLNVHRCHVLLQILHLPGACGRRTGCDLARYVMAASVLTSSMTRLSSYRTCTAAAR